MPRAGGSPDGHCCRGDEIEVLSGVDVRKATEPDDVNPKTLKHCASELTRPLS